MAIDPPPAETPAREVSRTAVASVSTFGGCVGALMLVALVVGGLVAWRSLKAILDGTPKVADAPAAPVEAPGGEVLPTETDALRRATLDSGQVIEGDFEIRSLDDALAAGDLEGAMAIAIENAPVRLRALLADGTFDPNLKLRGSEGYFALPLEKAARQGADGTFEILLTAGADPNGRDSGLHSALHSAAGDGSTEIVRRLLAAGADPNLPGENDQRAIESAAYAGHLETVEALLAGGAERHFALHAASWSGNLDLVRALLAAGADPTALTQYGDSAIRGAAGKGHLEVVEVLLRAGAQPGEQALREAAQFGHVDVLRACARAGTAFDAPPAQWDPLYTAAYHGQVESVRVLLELGASANGYDRSAPTHPDYPATPLAAARERGYGEVASLLESAGRR